jgi:osmoprotectant transport system ATP-binding protein
MIKIERICKFGKGDLSLIQYENVSKSYQAGLNAVSDFTLSIAQGELLAIIGPSGCGKTTVLKLLNRLVEPTSGRILMHGQDIRELDPIGLRRKMGYVIQQVGLFPHMTILENITVVPDILGWPLEKQHARAIELLELINMNPADFAHRYPHQLSGGQQQRVGVLRALASDPEVMLMDEPFGAVDPLTRTKLQQELKALHNRLHKTILLVTHDIDEALLLADRILLMREGRIVQYGSPADLIERPTDRFVTEYIGVERRKPCLL